MSQTRRIDFSFGSLAFNEHHHGRNTVHRATPDRARRVQAAGKHLATRKGQAEMDEALAVAHAQDNADWGDTSRFDFWPITAMEAP